MKIMSRNVDVSGTNVAAARALFSQNATNTVAKHPPKLGPKPAQPSPRVSPSPKSSPVIEATSRRSPNVGVPVIKPRQPSFTSVEHLKSKFQNIQTVRSDPPERVKTPNGNESNKTFINTEKEQVQAKGDQDWKAEEPKEPKVEEVKHYPTKPPMTICKDKSDRVDAIENSKLEENSALIIPPEPIKPLQANTSQLANIIDRHSVRNPPERWYANITAIEIRNLLTLPLAPPTPISTFPVSTSEPIFKFGNSVWRKKPLPPLSTIGQLPPPKPQRPSAVTAHAKGAWADLGSPQLPERKPFPGTNNSGLGSAQFLPQRRTHVNTPRESCDPPSVFEERVDSFITPTTSSNEELYDDTASQVPPPPPRPERLTRAMPATVETEDLYDDTSIRRSQEGEIYEDISQEILENAHYENGDFSRKSKSLFRLRRDSKDKEKKQKDPDKLKKKFHLTGQEIVVETGIIKETVKNKKGDFSVRKGERIRILRMSNNPAGKWLVINETGEMGYVELTNIEVDANSVKSVMFQSNTPPASMRSIPEAHSYQGEDAEAIYEEFH